MRTMLANLKPRVSTGSTVQRTASGGWRLTIQAGDKGHYRLAQLDDYAGLSRRRFPWRAPLRIGLRARSSAQEIPGTWGMGLWNDPFSLSLGLGGASQRLPALPNAAWFFFASPPNHLSFRDDLPGYGAMAATYRASSPALLAIISGLPLLPLLAIPAAARLIRRGISRLIRQGAAAIPQPAAEEWHDYEITWRADRVIFQVDNEGCLETAASPEGPLGLVLWVDNQYAAFSPEGRIGYGTLPNAEPAWIELENLNIATDSHR